MSQNEYNKLLTDRKAVLFYLNNDTAYWRIKFNHRNHCKRPMSRYSTRQLLNKMATIDSRNAGKSIKAVYGIKNAWGIA